MYKDGRKKVIVWRLRCTCIVSFLIKELIICSEFFIKFLPQTQENNPFDFYLFVLHNNFVLRFLLVCCTSVGIYIYIYICPLCFIGFQNKTISFVVTLSHNVHLLRTKCVGIDAQIFLRHFKLLWIHIFWVWKENALATLK